MLTNECLIEEKPHHLGGGVQRIYQLGEWGLSLVNAPILHFYPFAWEAAVLHNGLLDYSTPLTSDVEVFQTDDDANKFIESALEYFRENKGNQ